MAIGKNRVLLQQVRLFFVALQFLTRLPTPRWVGFEPAWLNASARYYPLVGGLVGCVAALVLGAAGSAFAPAVAAWLSMSATVLLTGAFHEDGLADTCDALGGAVSRERALEIMKDSRIGSYGAVGLVLVLGLKATTLASLLPFSAVPASIVAHAVSRAVPVLLIRWLPYAGSVAHAKAKPLAQGISGVDAVVALVCAASICTLCVATFSGTGRAIAASVGGAALTTLASGRWLRRRLGGYTGDTLGATQQVSELLILLIWLGVAR